MTAIDRISRTAHDPTCAQAARLAIGATLLGQAVTTETAAETVNAILQPYGWRMSRMH